MQDHPRAETLANAEAAAGPKNIETFVGVAREFHTVAHVVRSARESVEAIQEILGQVEPKSVVAAGLPTAARMLVESALKGFHHRFVEDLKPSEALSTISKADVGITWAQYGAALQGCFVEVTYDDAVKLASSLPRVHIALLSSKDLLPDLPSAIARVADLLRDESRGERKPVVSIISGPSKTADIEMLLVYGVHGPHTLHVILLDWL